MSAFSNGKASDGISAGRAVVLLGAVGLGAALLLMVLLTGRELARQSDDLEGTRRVPALNSLIYPLVAVVVATVIMRFLRFA